MIADHTVVDHTMAELALINKYKAGESAYFSSPKNTILAHPPFAALLDLGMCDLNRQVIESLRLATELGHLAPIVIGAIPFDISKPSMLRLSTSFSCEKAATNSSNPKPMVTNAPTLGKFSIRPVPLPEEFIDGVSEALNRFSRKELKKVV